MAKLILEDDNGTKHDIEMRNISSKSLSEGDTLVITYEVGNADPTNTFEVQQVRENLQHIKTTFESLIPKGVNVVVTAVKDGKKDIDFKILKHKKD